MNWYKQAQSHIILINYIEGNLQAIINGQEIFYENVDIESFKKITKYLKWWKYDKALELLSQFKNTVHP